jgi:hypothetical protein
MSEAECLGIAAPTLTEREILLSARLGGGGKPIPGRLFQDPGWQGTHSTPKNTEKGIANILGPRGTISVPP